MNSPAKLWPGPDAYEANLAFNRVILAGLGPTRALVAGCVASFRDCWMFQAEIGRFIGKSLRTVQRCLRELANFGFIERHRSKKREVPPGAKGALPCGWSHRWAVGKGLAKAACEAAINVARVLKLIPGAFSRKRRKPAEPPPRPRRWTVEEIEAELARTHGQAPPD